MKYIISTETFRDIFSTMNINNYRLTNTESLCHLVQTTKGEAKETISLAYISSYPQKFASGLKESARYI